MKGTLLILIVLTLGIASCVSPSKFQAANSQLGREISNLESKISSLNSQITRLSERTYTLESQLQTQTRLHNEEVGDLRMKIDDIEDRNKNLKDLVTTLRREVARLKSQL